MEARSNRRVKNPPNTIPAAAPANVEFQGSLWWDPFISSSKDSTPANVNPTALNATAGLNMVNLRYSIPREGPEVIKFLWEKANLSG
jgi:hypothetical protein